MRQCCLPDIESIANLLECFICNSLVLAGLDLCFVCLSTCPDCPTGGSQGGDRQQAKQRYGDTQAPQISLVPLPFLPILVPCELLSLIVFGLADVAAGADHRHEPVMNQFDARGITAVNDPQETMPVGQRGSLLTAQLIFVNGLLLGIVATKVALDQVLLDEPRRVRFAFH